VRYTLERLGPHGLPLIGRADWNDCLNLNCFSQNSGESFQTTENKEGGVAESVFIAGQFVVASRELVEIARAYAKLDDVAKYEADARRMIEVIEHHGWDGEWFLRAYDYFGNVVGSQSNDEGKIFAEPQGMCVMAGVGLNDGRADQAMASVRDLLATEHGVMLVQPSFTRYHLELGEISTYPPGYKENGSIFCHVNPWIMIAETMLGHGDAAFEYYKRTNPSARAVISDVHRCEPYVYAQMIAGRDAPSFGEAKNSWLTGSASWHITAITQWILGIRPELAGLRIDPVLPSSWPGFSAVRKWRGATYEIMVRQEPGVTGRVRRLVVDGKSVDTNVVPEAPAGSTVRIEAVLEASSSD
jgi:cellobiose phosphorylase